MQREYLEHLATLRAVVGFLGERDQPGWWPSSFFGAGSSAFVTPVFPRTHFLAQCLGVTGAALKVHDERIGVGRVFHLFRLPEDLEQGIHRVLHDDSCVAAIREKLVDREAAMRFLNEGQLKGGGDSRNVNKDLSLRADGLLRVECRIITAKNLAVCQSH